MRRAAAALLLRAVVVAAGLPAVAAGAEPEAGGGPPLLRRDDRKLEPDRVEVGLLPAVAFNSDVGLGLGAFGNVAKFHPDFAPYRARFFARFFLWVRESPEGGPSAPVHGHLLRLELPSLAGGPLRLDVELPIRRNAIAGYYGLGNGSVNDKPWQEVDRDAAPARYARLRRVNWYDRVFPALRVGARVRLPGRALLFGSVEGTWHAVEVYDGSALAADRDGASGAWVRERVELGLSPSFRLLSELGLAVDLRDHEHAPTRGLFVETSVRAGPAFGETPWAGGGLNLTVRGYVPIAGEKLVLALRGMGDLLFGELPFHELGATGGLYPVVPFGGGRSVRGLPPERLHGKVKLLGNVEARSTLFRFVLLGQRFAAGAVGFVDVGRVWADLRPRPELDGGPPVRVGLGGGLRLGWGETLILRIDGAWAPEEGGALYFDVDHVF